MIGNGSGVVVVVTGVNVVSLVIGNGVGGEDVGMRTASLVSSIHSPVVLMPTHSPFNRFEQSKYGRNSISQYS